MPLPPITHQLSNFEQIEILRNEIEEFEEELKKTESRIRDVVYQIEKQRFLTAIHRVFQEKAPVEDAKSLPEMSATRESLVSALESMRTALSELEAASGPAPARPPQRPNNPLPTRAAGIAPPFPAQSPGSALPPRKNRFDAF